MQRVVAIAQMLTSAAVGVLFRGNKLLKLRFIQCGDTQRLRFLEFRTGVVADNHVACLLAYRPARFSAVRSNQRRSFLSRTIRQRSREYKRLARESGTDRRSPFFLHIYACSPQVLDELAIC